MECNYTTYLDYNIPNLSSRDNLPRRILSVLDDNLVCNLFGKFTQT